MKLASENTEEQPKYFIFNEKIWLGREGSNLRMAESKSPQFPLPINANSEKFRKFDVNLVNFRMAESRTICAFSHP